MLELTGFKTLLSKLLSASMILCDDDCHSYFCVYRFNRNLLTFLGLLLFFAALIAVYIKGPYKDEASMELHIPRMFDLSKNREEHMAEFQVQNHKRDEQHGYVFVMRYNGQQGAAIQALLSMQCWVSTFNLPMYILEPVMSGTIFVSFPHHQEDTFLTFGDVFDIEHFNRMSESMGYALMASREEFFSNAPRNVIFVYPGSKDEISKVVWKADSKHGGKQKCYKFEGGRLLHLAQEHSFCCVRIVQLQATGSKMFMTDKEVQEVIFGDNLPQSVTLIFAKWQTTWYVEREELDNPSVCKKFGKASSKEQFLPSPRLLSDVKRYEKHFLNSSNDVALMLRIERMTQFIDRHSQAWTVDKCLNEAVKLKKELQISGHPMVTLDLGMFGSGSISRYLGPSKETLTEKSNLLITELYDNKLTFEEWEGSFTKATGGVENSGYIAALQRTLASRAKCLILVGGGTFQDLALKDYLKNHRNKEDQCIHIVCALNGLILQRVIDSNNGALVYTESTSK